MHAVSVRKDSKSSDLTVSITGTRCGRSFDFSLKSNRLLVSPTSAGKPGATADWYEALTEKERTDVMNYVLAEYRMPSLHSQLWKGAAIGIYRNPDENAPPEKRHLIYVGVNSDLRANELSKDCAEQHMFISASNSMAQYQYHKRGIEMGYKPWPIEMHVMVAREPDPEKAQDKGQSRAALCGGCTDTSGAEDAMHPDANVFIYPANNGRMPLVVNTGARSIDDRALKGNDVWKTTIGHLNAHRRIKLLPEHAALQRAGLEKLIDELLDAPSAIPEAVGEQAKRNIMQRRHSIAELDIAVSHGTCEPAALNHYMHGLIVETLRSRMRKAGIEPNRNAIKDWLTQSAMEVAVAVAQYQDGTFTAGIEPSRRESAQQNAALSIVGSVDGVIKGGDTPVTHLFTQSFRMRDIEEGFTTLPSKEELERASKRAAGNELLLANIVFNGGNLDDEGVEAVSEPYSPSFVEQFPGGFRGGWRGGATNAAQRTWAK